MMAAIGLVLVLAGLWIITQSRAGGRLGPGLVIAGAGMVVASAFK